jgi:hypothetical protein
MMYALWNETNADKPYGEMGCGHAPHPWVPASVNSLLAGQKERDLKFLKNAKMDNGIACELGATQKEKPFCRFMRNFTVRN